MLSITKRIRVVLALATLVAALAATGVMGGAVASAAPELPSVTGCGAGFELLSVAALEAGPYIIPRFVDEAGNANGLVCGLALPDAVRDVSCRKYSEGPACELQRLGLPVYNFKDDDNPA